MDGPVARYYEPMPCDPVTRDSSDLARLASDPEYAREGFERDGLLIDTVLNWMVTLKRGPYTLKDAMVMLYQSRRGNGQIELALEDLSEEDLFNLLYITGKLFDGLKGRYPQSEF